MSTPVSERDSQTQPTNTDCGTPHNPQSQIHNPQSLHWVRHECGTERVSMDEARSVPRLPVYGVFDCIRSAHNVGSMFRTADGANAAELLLCGYTACPPHRHLAKTALGAVDVVPWRHCANVADAISILRGQGVEILAAEYDEDSVPLHDYRLRFPLALVMGNEADGLSEATRALCDATVHLPMRGLKNSLNVSVAFGVALYEIARRYDEAARHSRLSEGMSTEAEAREPDIETGHAKERE